GRDGDRRKGALENAGDDGSRDHAGPGDADHHIGVVVTEDLQGEHAAKLPKEGPVDLQHPLGFLRGGTGAGGSHGSGFYIASVNSRKLFSPHGFLAPLVRGRLVGRRRSQAPTSRLPERGVSPGTAGGL